MASDRPARGKKVKYDQFFDDEDEKPNTTSRKKKIIIDVESDDEVKLSDASDDENVASSKKESQQKAKSIKTSTKSAKLPKKSVAKAAKRSKKKKDNDSDDESGESDNDVDDSVGANELASSTIVKDRIKVLNKKTTNPAAKYVLYWMQASVRAEYNHALEYAVQKANELQKPLVAFFGITDNYPEANERHYAFMLEGVQDAKAALAKRGVQLVVLKKSPELAAIELAQDASLLVIDRGYLRIQRRWREHVADKAPVSVVQVEGDVVVPVEVASPKEEFAARTIRPKITKHLITYLRPLEETKLEHGSLELTFPAQLDLSDLDKTLASLKIDRTVPRVSTFIGGTAEAKKHLEKFITTKLRVYKDKRNEPADDYVSHMSPYLHFGQISPIYIALEAIKRASNKESKESFIEELVVRRELSMNFIFYNDKYDSYEGLPDWAQKTLEKHAKDKREAVYTAEQLELGKTKDPYWNASQKEMVITGKMHNYMRMYWGKKILEWCETPQEAFRITLYLNNKYELDGRDPNSFTGVAWIFGKHDRPWGPERPVFGLIRYMNAAGLKRKLNIEAYVNKVRALEAKAKTVKKP